MEQNQVSQTAPAAVEASKPAEKEKKKISLKLVITIVIIVVAILALGGLLYRYKSVFVAATVNGESISRLSVIKELEKQGGKATLNMLINKKLIASEAKAKGISVSQDEISAEIKKYEDQFNVNGQTLDDTLKAQGMTREDLKTQIVIQKQVEKILADKVNVTDAEVDQYITENKITLTKEQEAAAKAQIKEQLRQQKLSTESSKLVTDLTAKAKINRYVNY